MPAVSVERMKEIERGVLASGRIDEMGLIRAAGTALGHAIARQVGRAGVAVGFLGKGHNAGDVVVALQTLQQHHGWRVAVRPGFPQCEWTPLTRQLGQEAGLEVLDCEEIAALAATDVRPLVLLDGLVGTGAKGVLRAPLAGLVQEMNFLRSTCGATVVAVDVPSGTDADGGTTAEHAVQADLTFLIANPKRGLLLSTAAAATGALAVVPLLLLRETSPASDIELICPQEMRFASMPRAYDTHKGDYGRVWLWVGSPDYAGAAALAAGGALHAGAGLVTVFTPPAAMAAVRAMTPPEVMLRPLIWEALPEPERCDALVLGCGLGPLDASATAAWLAWLERFHGPAVIDADALNALARHGGLSRLQPRHVVTPHPGEMSRLFPHAAGGSREQTARLFSETFQPVLLLKGARTLVARRDQPLWCNGTGGPSMACGGQGDLLAGVIGALLARGLPPHEAAALGAWTCGRAAELAISRGQHSEESLTPTASSLSLGQAFSDWRRALR